MHLDRTALSPPKLICHFPLSTGGGRGSRKTVHRGIKRPSCEGRPAPRPPCLSRGRRMSEQHGAALAGCALLPEMELHLLKVTRWKDMPPAALTLPSPGSENSGSEPVRQCKVLVSGLTSHFLLGQLSPFPSSGANLHTNFILSVVTRDMYTSNSPPLPKLTG